MKIPRKILETLLFLVLALPLHADPYAPFPADLPTPDRAEIISVAPGETDGPKVALNAAQAIRLIPMLRALTFTGPAGGCDKVQYLLRFYAKDKIIAANGICFHCGCFVALDADLHSSGDAVFFDPRTPKAQELESRLAKFFSANN